MKRNDILLVARPDHSLQIYEALCNQDKLTFRFITYKVFPQWVKKLVPLKKMVAFSKNVSNSYMLTLINICKYTYGISYFKNIKERGYLDRMARTFLQGREVRIIHYWPEYGNDHILEYARNHKECITLADVHMPHPKIVYKEMLPVYEKYGIIPEMTGLARIVEAHKDLLNGEKNVLVPSEYVARTYKEVFPDLKTFVVSYGVSKSEWYTKKVIDKVTDFVYAGRVSLEKGSDLVLEFFSIHPEYNLHIFGTIDNLQDFIFRKYTNYPNIIFHGQVAKAELQSMMSKFHAGIHMSRFDAYSLAVGEMIGVGLPVIVSENTGNKDDVNSLHVGCVTDLSISGIENAVNRLTNIENYKKYIDNIDSLMHGTYKGYGDNMCAFYSSLL